MLTFDDFAVGDMFSHAPVPVTAEAIVAFAREYDPQPFHTEPNSPEAAAVGCLIASGWHVSAILMRMLCDTFLLDTTCLGAPGVDSLKWQKPVRPGDTLAGTSTVVEVKPSRSRADRGMVRFRHELTNQAGETVLVADNPVLFGRTP